MTIDINGYEINLDIVFYVTPIHQHQSPIYAKQEDVNMRWQSFSIVSKGKENNISFYSNYGKNEEGDLNFKTERELQMVRQKVIDALNKNNQQ